MGEVSNMKGKLIEENATYFFVKLLKWKLMSSNIDINDNGGGADLFVRVFDPFFNKYITLLIECKYREKLNKKDYFGFIDTLKKKVKDLSFSNKLEEFPFFDEVKNDIKNFGILFSQCNNFDSIIYNNILKDYSIIQKSSNVNAPVVFTIGNDKINFFYRFLKKYRDKKLEFYYPDFAQNNKSIYLHELSFSYLFSDIIIGKYEENNKEVKFIISFEDFTTSNFKYLHNNILGGLQIRDKVKKYYFVQKNNFNNLDLKQEIEIEHDIKIETIKLDSQLAQNFGGGF